MVNSRQKGKRAELALKNKLNELFDADCRRGQQFCGANGDADVVGLDGIHIECKAVEALNVHNAIKQAVDDAREGDTPVVMHKKNKTDWLVTVKLDDLPEFAKKINDIASD